MTSPNTVYAEAGSFDPEAADGRLLVNKGSLMAEVSYLYSLRAEGSRLIDGEHV